MQFSLMHAIFYTKAQAVTHTWYGLCIRVFTPLVTVVALSFFFLLLGNGRHKAEKSRYRRVVIAVTYVLLVGAVILQETTSALRAMFSSWTCALLEEQEQGRNVWQILSWVLPPASTRGRLEEAVLVGFHRATQLASISCALGAGPANAARLRDGWESSRTHGTCLLLHPRLGVRQAAAGSSRGAECRRRNTGGEPRSHP
jgi:hypothetical protein